MDGPARRENGDDAIFLEIELSENTIRALVDTGASDCFISKAMREQLPADQIIDTWKVDEGQIQLANNLASCMQTNPYHWGNAHGKCPHGKNA